MNVDTPITRPTAESHWQMRRPRRYSSCFEHKTPAGNVWGDLLELFSILALTSLLDVKSANGHRDEGAHTHKQSSHPEKIGPNHIQEKTPSSTTVSGLRVLRFGTQDLLPRLFHIHCSYESCSMCSILWLYLLLLFSSPNAIKRQACSSSKSLR